MTPKEKAKELVDKQLFAVSFVFDKHKDSNYINCIKVAKQCALICVDALMEITAPYCDRYEDYYLKLRDNKKSEYWQEVKQEIEKL